MRHWVIHKLHFCFKYSKHTLCLKLYTSFQNKSASSIKNCIPQTQVRLVPHSFPQNIHWHCNITQVPVPLEITIYHKLHSVTTSTLSHYGQLATSGHLPVPLPIKLLFFKEPEIHIL